jgi:hypothetical protein
MRSPHIQEDALVLELLVATSWIVFILYAAWFAYGAKRYVMMSPRDAYVLWSLHKRETRCNAHRYSLKLHKKEGIIGFRCLCGYEYVSKRPILA